eukprot:XP_001709606.1 Hypothetical protein GL50803_38184 [Giardia lamblia ATCC 50803]
MKSNEAPADGVLISDAILPYEGTDIACGGLDDVSLRNGTEDRTIYRQALEQDLCYLLVRPIRNGWGRVYDVAYINNSANLVLLVDCFNRLFGL